MKNREQKNDAGAPVPGFTVELGSRISLAIDRIGGLKKAADAAGTSDETLANWRDGRSRPSLFGVIGLAQAAGVSLEWLAVGDGEKMRGGGEEVRPVLALDEDALRDAVVAIEEHLVERNQVLDPINKAVVISTLYHMRVEERAKYQGSSDEIREELKKTIA
jgi:hypothetical protein